MTNLPQDGAYVLPFEQLWMTDVEVVGGKNASLGEMIPQPDGAGVRVPDGFTTTILAFCDFLAYNNLTERISQCLAGLDVGDVKALAAVGKEIREWAATVPFQLRLKQEIRESYVRVAARKGAEVLFAVRSSATAEDLSGALFAGQQEGYLNVLGIDDVLDEIKHVSASLYNGSAIPYRVHKGFAYNVVALSVGTQRMIRSNCGASGVMFTIDTESGFQDVAFITSSYGLGETVVQDAVNPDEFYVFKPTLAAGKYPVIRRSIGSKLIKMELIVLGEQGRVETVGVPGELRNHYSINDADVAEPAKHAVIIEKHYGRPMDIEQGKDDKDGKIYILQACPETVKNQVYGKAEQRFRLKGSAPVLTTGRAIGQEIGTGPVRMINDPVEMERVQPGDVLAADMIDPNREPVMKRASATITNRGGWTCHAVIIACELGVPAVVGCGDATGLLKGGTLVMVSCAEGDEGKIYDGLLETEVTEVQRGEMPAISTKTMMNISDPQLALDFCQIPNGGVGLARLEFIINNNIGVHSEATLDYPQVDSDLRKAVGSMTRGHASPRAFYVDKLAEGIAIIAAAFYPKPVIVRLSDFKSNEYKKLIGGSRYKPDEENPMLSFRGASRYIAEDLAEALGMGYRAMKRVRDEMGLTNVEVTVSFVRMLGQAEKVIEPLAKYDLKRGENGLRLIMTYEVPSNAILAEQFLQYFDGFSTGSSDLTQLTFGLDRDSDMELLAKDSDERDPAIKFMLQRAISTALSTNKYVGICGQSLSDHPDLAEWLAKKGISSTSLNPDSVVDTRQKLGSA